MHTLAGRDRRAAQEFVGLHRLAAGALQFDEPHRAARRRRPSACRRARGRARLRPAPFGGAQNFDAARVGEFEPGAGKRRQAAAMVVDLAPRPASSRCGFRSCRSCWRRSRRLSACGVSCSDAAFQRAERDAPSDWRRAAPAHRADRRWSHRAPIGTRSAIATGPVSRPSSIRITMTPVSRSPAMMARWIGAAPRQRGNSEACRLKQPSGNASRIGFGRINP